MHRREPRVRQPQMRLPQSPPKRHRVRKQAAKEDNLVEQAEQDVLVERREARAVATLVKCSAVCPRRRSPICKRVMR